MALATGTHWEMRASATTGNTNGAGFNPTNAAFPTDGTVDTNTGNTASPVFSSATYNFVAGDVGAWLYIAAGTNCLVGWYQIASVAANKATLSAAIGAGVAYTAVSDTYAPSTVVGIASVGTPSSITFGIDYSQQDTAQATATDFASVGASTTLTSASAPFTRMMVGNVIHITTTGTGAHFVTGWYEIATYTNTTTVVLDRTPNDGTAGAAGTGFIGGAGRWNGLEDALLEASPASSIFWTKLGTYSISASINIASTTSTPANPSFLIGYTALRGDPCIGANRPVLACGANTSQFGQNQNIFNFIVTSTSGNGLNTGTNGTVMNVKATNSSTNTNRPALTAGSNGYVYNSELISQNGPGVSCANASLKVIGCYIHDSRTGISASGASSIVIDNIIEACDNSGLAFTSATGNHTIYSNTIYGTEAKVIGTGITFTGSAPNNRIHNNIIYGWANGVTLATVAQRSNVASKNDYFNNTTDTTLLVKDVTDLAVNPQFSGAAQITGTTATTSGSVLTQAGGDFSSVTDNVDFLHILSGTGITQLTYLITGHTATTLTVNNSIGTSAAGDCIYYVTTGHNFVLASGSALKNAGFPSWTALGVETIDGAPSVGAVQIPAGSGGSFTFA